MISHRLHTTRSILALVAWYAGCGFAAVVFLVIVGSLARVGLFGDVSKPTLILATLAGTFGVAVWAWEGWANEWIKSLKKKKEDRAAASVRAIEALIASIEEEVLESTKNQSQDSIVENDWSRTLVARMFLSNPSDVLAEQQELRVLLKKYGRLAEASASLRGSYSTPEEADDTKALIEILNELLKVRHKLSKREFRIEGNGP